MRILFSTVALLSIILAGLSVLEIREVRNERAILHRFLSDIDKSKVASARAMHMSIETDSVEYMYFSSDNSLSTFESGWKAVLCVAGVLFAIGIAGIIIGLVGGKVSPNKALQPTAAVPGANGFMKFDCQACIGESGSAAVAELLALGHYTHDAKQ